MNSFDRRRNTAGPWGTAPAHPPNRFARRLLIILALLLLLFFALVSVFPPVQLGTYEWSYVVRTVLVLSAIVVGIAASNRRLTSMAGDTAIWLVVGLVLIAGYGYRFELQGIRDRVFGELMPSQGQSREDGTVSFKRSSDGHFRMNAVVNGQAMRFLVDTGASSVVLNQADAARLDFDPAKLDYTTEFTTANGITRGAPIRLDQIRIGPLRFDDVPASVNQGELQESLLGMRLLERLSKIEISADTLTIRQ